MVRTLSSAFTFIYKYVYTFFWLFGFGGAVVVIIFDSGWSKNGWAAVLIWVLGAVSAWMFCGRLKRVRMDEKHLYISNYLQEIRVPLRNVIDIRNDVWIGIQPVTLQFSPLTSFGSSVVFMPKIRFRNIGGPHPVVKEIEEAVRHANWSELLKKKKVRS
jgi:hypothetical protein